MSLTNDYFLLYHGAHYTSEDALVLEDLEEDFFCEVSALVLSTNRKNFSYFFALSSFKDFLKQMSTLSLNSFEELHLLQFHLIKRIQEKKSKQYIHKLHTSFKYLETKELLSTQNCEKLISLFDPHEFHSFEETLNIDEKDNKKDFLEQKNEMMNFIKELQDLGENLSYRNELKEIQDYLNKQKFSIGITGVMNAGKSTLLNALMGKEVLGTSVVPETANLSLLKYSSQPYARVFYWSKKEWQKIIYSAQEFEAIALFVKESEDIFEKEFDSYILDEGRVDDIKVQDLSLYTSAKHNKSNLIKEIELGVDLDFLKEGIEIVDTPGLDDVVIQREEITKGYLSQCDLMIHLMNVSQSATQKDIDFIIDALMYQNIGKLLIILTKADSVSEKELKEVVSYTKKSIKTQLARRNEESKFDFILSNLEFIALSSKMALLHKLGKGDEALKEGYSLEKTGILKLEESLHETLYGEDSQKSELIINSAKAQLFKSIERQVSSLQYELRLLSKNEEEIAKELEVLNLKKDENIQNISQMREELLSCKADLNAFSKGLDSFIEAQLFRAKTRLQSRLMDDFTYSLEKKKTKEFLDNLNLSLDLALKDTMVDVLRDYRYKFIQKSQTLAKKIHLQYESYELTEIEIEEGSVLESVNKHFKAGLVQNASYVLCSKLQKAFSKAKEKNLSSLSQQVQENLQESYDNLNEELNLKVEVIAKALIEELYISLSKPLVIFEKNLEDEEELLSYSLINYEKDEGKRGEHSLYIHKQLKVLGNASKRCQI